MARSDAAFWTNSASRAPGGSAQMTHHGPGQQRITCRGQGFQRWWSARWEVEDRRNRYRVDAVEEVVEFVEDRLGAVAGGDAALVVARVEHPGRDAGRLRQQRSEGDPRDRLGRQGVEIADVPVGYAAGIEVGEIGLVGVFFEELGIVVFGIGENAFSDEMPAGFGCVGQDRVPAPEYHDRAGLGVAGGGQFDQGLGADGDLGVGDRDVALGEGGDPGPAQAGGAEQQDDRVAAPRSPSGQPLVGRCGRIRSVRSRMAARRSARSGFRARRTASASPGSGQPGRR